MNRIPTDRARVLRRLIVDRECRPSSRRCMDSRQDRRSGSSRGVGMAGLLLLGDSFRRRGIRLSRGSMAVCRRMGLSLMRRHHRDRAMAVHHRMVGSTMMEDTSSIRVRNLKCPRSLECYGLNAYSGKSVANRHIHVSS